MWTLENAFTSCGAISTRSILSRSTESTLPPVGLTRPSEFGMPNLGMQFFSTPEYLLIMNTGTVSRSYKATQLLSANCS